MIVWFNCKISDIRPNPQPRFCLRNDNRFDIARYSFASFAPLEPLVSRFVFNLELADAFANRESEMEAWLRGIFPAHKLVINWHRCNNLEQWLQFRDSVADLDDPLIFPAGNEDHIFMDSTIEVFRRGLELIQQDPHPAAVLMTSHYPESIRAAYHFGGALSECGNWAHYFMGNNDAIRVMKRELFDWYLDRLIDPNKFVFRTEHWNDIVVPENKIYIPTKEQFRHFDGYAHVKIGPGVCPPLEIPTDFFTGMTIKYGYKDRDPNTVNINPCADNLYCADPVNGTDYKFTLADLPAFWTPYTKHVDIATDADSQALAEARDLYMLSLSRVEFDWWHVNTKFDKTNYPPADWINRHMLCTLFEDPKPVAVKSFGSSLSTV